ncbi:MAG: c-type cytochrome, methanol metabolism-related [Acetobacteraceae bacterium]|nr:c-type cytochrome, methanol metabolism-related [Acetobacteraceae bacterium]
MKHATIAAGAMLGMLTIAVPAIGAGNQNSNSAAVKQQPDGMWTQASGTPTYKIGPDGTVDWYTYEGFVQYSANCLQCHGPDGLGTSYGPNLTERLKTLSYGQFLGTVAGGKKAVSTSQDLVMPAFGLNKNVMCYINPIYVYLRARADGAVGRGRPPKHVEVPDAFNKEIDSCFGP